MVHPPVDRVGRHVIGGQYHIVKLVAALRRIGADRNLRNPHYEQVAYEAAVKAIFSSQPTDVDVAIVGDPARRIEEELSPVLDELRKLRIVTA
jgi:hypothetical protein